MHELAGFSKKELLPDPDKKVFFNARLPIAVMERMRSRSRTVFFTKKSLKHIVEKGQEGERLIFLAKLIIENPDMLLKAKGKDRYLLVKALRHPQYRRPHVVGLEILGRRGNIIVTLFQSDSSYLSNFELLWRTGSL